MIADLGYDAARKRSPSETAATPRLSAAGALDLLEPTQRAVAEALAGGPRNVDGLCRATGFEAGVVAASLTMLQLRGWARVLGATHLPAGPLLEVDSEARP
jgi:predicted Rossmann fold nucleotide-binding protein DprA/Smf involved in DNA uptake